MPYMLLYTVLILPIVSFLHLLIIYRFCSFRQYIDRITAIKGERVKYTINFKNMTPFFAPYISIKFLDTFCCFNDTPLTKHLSVLPFCKAVLSYDLECKYRGAFTIGISEIQFEDFLGIVRLTRKKSSSLCFTIYPRIIHLEKLCLLNNSFSDSHSGFIRRTNDSISISGIRKYVYGDSLKKVHWKMTAKMQELIVKDLEGSADSDSIFFLDLKKSFMGEYKLLMEDKLIEISLAVIYYNLNRLTPVTVHFNHKDSISLNAKNPDDFNIIYETLSKIDFSSNLPLYEVVRFFLKDNIHRSNLIIATSTIEHELYRQIYDACMIGHNVILFYISSEAITGRQNSFEAEIVESLNEIGVRFYKIGLFDDIRAMLEDISYEYA